MNPILTDRQEADGRLADAVATYDVLGVPIAALQPDAARDRVLAFAREGSSRQVHLCNSYTLTLACRDTELARALARADLNLPDGTPVAWLGRSNGTDGPVRGPGLVLDVMLAGVTTPSGPGVRHYLYGGAPGVAERMAAAVKQRSTKIEIVGIESPPYGRATESAAIALATRINDSGADIVWIGLGTPQQDYLVGLLAGRVSATLVPVGAAFDFISGQVSEAPKFLHGSGFEWVYRLLREPRRLWRRYLVDGVRFVFLLARSMTSRTIRRPSNPNIDGNGPHLDMFAGQID